MKTVLGKFDEYKDISHLDLDLLNEESHASVLQNSDKKPFKLEEESGAPSEFMREPESHISNISMRTFKAHRKQEEITVIAEKFQEPEETRKELDTSYSQTEQMKSSPSRKKSLSKKKSLIP